MTEKKELNLEELEKIAGGTLDAECNKWVRRNFDTIIERARKNSIEVRTRMLLGAEYVKTEAVTTAELKQTLKDYGVDCDDLM